MDKEKRTCIKIERKRKLEETNTDEQETKRQRKHAEFLVSSGSTQPSSLKAVDATLSVKVRQIFQHVYEEVITLHSWLTRQELEGHAVLQDGDPQGYLNILNGTLVAQSSTQRAPPPTSLSQASHQREIILRVIQKLKRRNVNNVLCFGFETISDNPNAHVLGAMPNLEYRTPNSAFNRLQFSPWKTLLSRIGDELMTRLLEKTSLYCFVSPSNYVQLTGVPIYELLPQASVPLSNTSGCVQNNAIPKKMSGKRKRKVKMKKDENGKSRRIEEVKKSKKKTRKNSNPDKLNSEKPFSFHQLLPRQSMLYSKCLRERTPTTFCLNYSPTRLKNLILGETQDQDENHQLAQQNEKLLQHHGQQAPASSSTSGTLPNPIPAAVAVAVACTKSASTSTFAVPAIPPAVNPIAAPTSASTSTSASTLTSAPMFTSATSSTAPCAATTSTTTSVSAAPVPAATTEGNFAVQETNVCVGSRLQALCNQMIKRHRRCNYKSLLDRYCGVSPTFWIREGQLKQVPVFSRGGASFVCLLTGRGRRRKCRPTIGQLLDSTVPSRQVFLFLRALCFWLIPKEIFGDEANRKVFFKNLERILGLGIHDKYCLGQVLMNIKVTSYKHLFSGVPHLERVRVVAQVHWWIYTCIVFPIIKSFFYVTETNLHRNRLVFYRKRVWSQLQTRCLTAHLQKKMLSPISKKEVENLLATDQTLGISNLRFLPKLKTLRPVVNMGRKPEPWTKRRLSINSQLRTVLSVLQYHVKSQPELVGSGKFGFEDILEEYKTFVVRRQERGDQRPLYFVKTDINKCFDVILQDKLFGIVKDILQEDEEYITRRSVSVMVCGNKIRKIFHKETFTLADYEPDFVRFVKKRVEKEGITNRILIDQVIHSQPNTSQVLSTLRSHLLNNIIKIGKRFYRQTVGIGQGSVLSTMLCTLYTAHMEHRTRAPTRDEELMMRLVDDNLYITPHRDQAVAFLHTALEGSVEYNLHSNLDKVLINFHYCHPELGPVPTAHGKAWFPWCGMLIHQNNLCLSVDYTRYAGQAVRDTLTMDFSAQSGLALKNKMLLTLRSRCHALYLDPQINRVEVRVENVFKAFVLCAYKMHCFIRTVWPHSRRKNHVFLKKIILTLAHFVTFKQDVILKVYVEAYKSFSLKGIQVSSESRLSPLSLPLIHWLCVQAHILKLQEHHSMYRQLITLLRRYRTGYHRRMSVQDRKKVDSLKKIPEEFLELL